MTGRFEKGNGLSNEYYFGTPTTEEKKKLNYLGFTFYSIITKADGKEKIKEEMWIK